MFHGSKNKNYAREFLNLRAYMLYAWTPEFKDAFARYCLINLTGVKGRFHALDRFNKHEIRKLKNMIHPSSNPKSDDFFRKTVAFNFISLASTVDPLGDVKTVFREIMNDGIFKHQPGREAASCFKDLVESGLLKTATGVPVAVYKSQAQGNWRRGQQLQEGKYAVDSDNDVDEDDIQADRADSDEE
ncbi:hypothetical protein MMC07_004009 [Pseudocyphellaria aurata]|nr:hypothetical protein [Pseudocyphellaria aurata]